MSDNKEDDNANNRTTSNSEVAIIFSFPGDTLEIATDQLEEISSHLEFLKKGTFLEVIKINI